jgi:hypothetical protein
LGAGDIDDIGEEADGWGKGGEGVEDLGTDGIAAFGAGEVIEVGEGGVDGLAGVDLELREGEEALDGDGGALCLGAARVTWGGGVIIAADQDLAVGTEFTQVGGDLLEVMAGEADEDREAGGFVDGGGCGVTFAEEDGTGGSPVTDCVEHPFGFATGEVLLIGAVTGAEEEYFFGMDDLEGPDLAGEVGHGDDESIPFMVFVVELEDAVGLDALGGEVGVGVLGWEGL